MEVWKSIKGYEGIYEISNFGRVKSLSRITLKKNRWDQTFEYPEKERIKVPLTNPKTGYIQVGLSNNKNYKLFLAHRLVAFAFIPNPESKPCVNHINAIKMDNRVENLEWCTRSENTLHAFNLGLIKPLPCQNKRGKDNPNAKTVFRVDNYGNKKKYECISDAARELNIYSSGITAALKNKDKSCAKYHWEYAQV